MRLPIRPVRRATDPGWDDGDMAVFAASIGAALGADSDAANPRTTATRAAVLGAFAASPSGVPARRSRSRSWLALPLAGALVAVGALGVMASSAGQPLYGARLALEEVALPASGAAREAAQLDRLDARVREAVAAQQAGDGLALRASLDAFAGIADEAARQAAPDPGDASRARAQVAELERLRLAGAAETARIRAVSAGRGLLAALLVTPDAGGPLDVPGAGPGAGPGLGGPREMGGTGSPPEPTRSPHASSNPMGPGASGAGGSPADDPAGGGPGSRDPADGQGGGGSVREQGSGGPGNGSGPGPGSGGSSGPGGTGPGGTGPGGSGLDSEGSDSGGSGSGSGGPAGGGSGGGGNAG